MVDTAPNPLSTSAPLPDHSVVPAVWSRITNLDVDRGEGSWLITRDGTRYLDYSSGIGVTNTGHAHPRVAAAIAAQAAKIIHSQQNITYHEPGLRLYDRLRSVLPGGPWQAFLANSGAEAVEAAVKLARVATGRPAMLAFRYGYHGRTAQTMALTTAKDVYRGSFEPLPGSVYHTAYPYCYRAAGGAHSPDACTCDWEEQLDLTFHQFIYPDRVAGVIIEPVLGEGGYVVPPPGFLPRLREITRQHGILLIADEVQTGFGRTGEMFAVQHWDVEPDILVMAKGIASGLPLSGILARADLMAAWKPGTHGGTYGGNVVSCAAANATLDVIEDEGLVDQCPGTRRPVPGGPARAGRTPSSHRGCARPRSHGRDRADQARCRRRPRAGSGPDQADPGRGARPQPDRPDRRHLRQRRPDHPTAGHDHRRGRPGPVHPRREPDRRRRLTTVHDDHGVDEARARVAALLDSLARIDLQVVVVAMPDQIRKTARDQATEAAIIAGRGPLLYESTAEIRDVVIRLFARSGFTGTWAVTEMSVSVARARDRVAAAAAFEEAAMAAVVEDLVDAKTLEVLRATAGEIVGLKGIPSPGSLASFATPATEVKGPWLTALVVAMIAILVIGAVVVGSASGGIIALVIAATILGLVRRKPRSDP